MKNRVRVKICGITSLADALAAVDAGADALGFVFYERSPRHTTFEAAAKIIRNLPPYISKTGVFVDAANEMLQTAMSRVPLDVLQFHGNESPEHCAHFQLPVVKAFRIENEASLAKLSAYQTSAWLLDSFAPDQLGGTGLTFNWQLARAATGRGRPIILAGGLTPQNVAEAVHQAQPFAVDVSSGVEVAPGRKDAEKMAAFVAAVRSACQ